MSNITGSIQSPERLRAQAIAALVPFFMEGRSGDETTARGIAEGLLDGYKPATPKELQLATQIVAYGWTSLACLGAAAAVKHQSLEAMLDMQDVAIALNRSSMKSMRALEARRKERTKHPHRLSPENTRWDEGAFQLAINQALDAYQNATAKLAAYTRTREQAAPQPEPKPAAPKLPILSAEPMTPSVLRR
ncbi:MAG TPA: hypothetical protein VFG12_13930, partial [Rhodopila sp.]|nr:hypothetical protein [Rhodopila sp.]